MDIEQTLDSLRQSGNYRAIPGDAACGMVDMTSNDYLGIANRRDLQEEFFATHDAASLLMTASASRLLAGVQTPYTSLENTLAAAYGHDRKALLFNSGYHANVGMIQALAGKNTCILADKLVHASIIDGIRLSGASFERFRHNDYSHLERLAHKASAEGREILIVAESVYSMDGDRADIDALVRLKREYPGAILYVDEAHGVGVEGPSGLGLVQEIENPREVDIVVGTLGKALASAGAYGIMSEMMKQYMVNRCRSLIFSTALPPANMMWTEFIFKKMMAMDSERQKLRDNALLMRDTLAVIGYTVGASHIVPLHVGDPRLAVELSQKLRAEGFNVLPIRTPTVPPGTDRLRISLSAGLSADEIVHFVEALAKVKS